MKAKATFVKAAKSQRRNDIIAYLTEALTNERTFERLGRSSNEREIRTHLDAPLVEALKLAHKRLSPTISDDTAKRKADKSLIWESDAKSTINNTRFLGTQHRPDFKIQIDHLNIAVELKLGEKGSDIREGIGQGLVYVGSGDYDFVIYVFRDISSDKKIVKSVTEPREAAFIERLWQEFNIRLEVVPKQAK